MEEMHLLQTLLCADLNRQISKHQFHKANRWFDLFELSKTKTDRDAGDLVLKVVYVFM